MPDDRPYAYDVDGEKIYAGDLVMIIERQCDPDYGCIGDVIPVTKIEFGFHDEIGSSKPDGAERFTTGLVPYSGHEIRKVASWPQETE